ncbi:MAG TPA: peptidase domain-containing ABC transporter [Allosphingosinicella sp.]|nr:peptidase domain-containing ABC transporter [Allosphingosinicella sp.]
MRPVDLLDLGGGGRTPMIHQSEAAECGLACLAMLAGRHGLETDMAALRRRFSLSLKGTTLKTLMQIAESLGFNARPLRIEIGDLRQLALPAILHWDLSHFVVLTRITPGLRGLRFHIQDPARGPRVVREEALSRHFTGVALELSKSERFQPGREKSKLRIGQLWSKMSGLWAALRNVMLLSLVLQLVSLATPFYLQLAVDTAFPTFDSDLLKMLAIGFGGLMLVNMATSWLRSLILISLGNALTYQVVVNLYRHLVRLPLPWFEKRHVGDIISRFGSTQPIAQLVSEGLVAAVIDGIMAFVTLALMFVYSPLLAAVALVAWGLFAGLKLGFLQALRMRNVDAISTAAKESSSFIESVRGIAAIKAFGQEGNRQRLWQQRKADAVNAQIRLGRLTAGFDAAGQFVLAAERVLFVYLAITMAMGGAFTVGMIFAFQAYKQQFLDAATRLIDQAIEYRLLDVHLGRIADIALSKPEPRSELGPRERASGAIELRGVGFSYGAGEPEVLKSVNLRVEAGEMVALIGPSGGGKTTLLKLMMGLFQPSYGQVLVDGRPLHAPDEWRGQIGSVSQDDVLYAGTLAENIAFFDPEIDMARVREVARMAAIHDDIEAMPMGYETLVGDMGSVLSGGQKQRVLLARALYPRPAVLFVDEGTAHLDSRSEREVMEALSALPITRIVSSHRPLPVQSAQRVFLVKKSVIRLDSGAAAMATLAAAG